MQAIQALRATRRGSCTTGQAFGEGPARTGRNVAAEPPGLDAQRHGSNPINTYTRTGKDGASLRAAGWVCEGPADGGRYPGARPQRGSARSGPQPRAYGQDCECVFVYAHIQIYTSLQ